MKKNIIFTGAALILLVLTATVHGAVKDQALALEFKKTGFYINEKLFDDAFVSDQGNLVLKASEKFMDADQGKKNDFSVTAANTWKKISKITGRAVFVEIREGEKRTALWKSEGADSAVLIEQWGPEIKAETGRNIFMSLALSGDFAGTPSLNGTIGSYFLQNVLDSAINCSISGSGVSFGLSGRYHYLIDPKWDINFGAQLNYSAGGGTFDFALLGGASYFLSYRSSLDITLSIETSGIVTIGTGVTYYLDGRTGMYNEPAEPAPVKNRGAGNKTEYIRTVNTPARADTSEPTDTPESTDTPRPAPTPWPTSTPLPVLTVTPAETTAEIPAVTHSNEANYIQTPTVTNMGLTPAAAENTAISRNAVAAYTPGPDVTKEEVKKETEEEMKARLRKEILEELKNERNPENPKTGADEKGTTAGFFIEADGISIYRAVSNSWMGGGGRFGFGDDGIFGMSFIPEILTEANNPAFSEIFDGSLNVAFDFYPLGRSPSGIYIGPLIGARYFSYKPAGGDKELGFDLTAGGEAGVRFLMNAFVLDIGVDYRIDHNMTGNSSVMVETNPYQYIPKLPTGAIMPHVSLGVMFYGAEPVRPGEKQDGNAPENKKDGVRNDPKNSGTTDGTFLEVDLADIVRFVRDGTKGSGLRLGFGDDGIFGMSFILGGKYENGNETGIKRYLAGLDIAFDFYPGGRSPSRFYLGPVIGANFNMYQQNTPPNETEIFVSLTGGGEAGIRMLMNWFVLDIGASYYVHNRVGYHGSNPFNIPSMQNEFLYRLGMGVMFYGSAKNTQEAAVTPTPLPVSTIAATPAATETPVMNQREEAVNTPVSAATQVEVKEESK
jgi:hypothetical protein